VCKDFFFFVLFFANFFSFEVHSNADIDNVLCNVTCNACQTKKKRNTFFLQTRSNALLPRETIKNKESRDFFISLISYLLLRPQKNAVIRGLLRTLSGVIQGYPSDMSCYFQIMSTEVNLLH